MSDTFESKEERTKSLWPFNWDGIGRRPRDKKSPAVSPRNPALLPAAGKRIEEDIMKQKQRKLRSDFSNFSQKSSKFRRGKESWSWGRLGERQKMGLDGERKRVRQMGILSGGDAVGRSFGSAWSVPVAHTSTYHNPTQLPLPLFSNIWKWGISIIFSYVQSSAA